MSRERPSSGGLRCANRPATNSGASSENYNGASVVLAGNPPAPPTVTCKPELRSGELEIGRRRDGYQRPRRAARENSSDLFSPTSFFGSEAWLPGGRLCRLSWRPPTEKELAATYDLLRAWEEVVAAAREREDGVHFDSMAADRDLSVWFACWSPAESRWWQEDEEGVRSLGATGLSPLDDHRAQLGWLVPQESAQVLLVVTGAESSPPRTGSAATEHPVGLPGFDALFTPKRGLPPDPGRELQKLVPWLAALDARAMARLPAVPGCGDQGFNVRAVHIQNDELDEWFGYEVYPLGETSRRENIIGLIEPPAVFARPELAAPPAKGVAQG